MVRKHAIVLMVGRRNSDELKDGLRNDSPEGEEVRWLRELWQWWHGGTTVGQLSGRCDGCGEDGCGGCEEIQ